MIADILPPDPSGNTLRSEKSKSQPESSAHYPPANHLTKEEVVSEVETWDVPSEHGIYWLSPFTMVATFAFGVIMSAIHHSFYNRLNGTEVGDVSSQQWQIRAGSAFSFLIQLSLSSSVWVSYSQWLWRAMKQEKITLRCVNAAYNAQGSLLGLIRALVAGEIIRKITVGFALATVAWLLQLPSLFTPATLFVVLGTSVYTRSATVPVLDITNATLGNTFAYSIPTSDKKTYMFTGARSVISMMMVATASTGEIIPGWTLYNNSAYDISFYGPIVVCDESNSTVQRFIDAILDKSRSTPAGGSVQLLNAYYAMVPSFDTAGDPNNTFTVDGVSIKPLSSPRTQYPGNAMNELWLTYWRYETDSNGNFVRDVAGSKIPVHQYMTCRLHNATYDIGLSFMNGVQNVTKHEITVGDVVPYPNDVIGRPSNMTQHGYSAIFWAMTNLLVGTMGCYKDLSANTNFSSIGTQVIETSILGSNDLDFFFDLNHKCLNASWVEAPLGEQRLQDKAVAKNQTLPYLIQDMSINFTISLMHNPILTRNVTADVTTRRTVNNYQYSAFNLWLPYGLAIAFAAAANILGGLAYGLNHASHDMSMSMLLAISRDPDIDELFPPCCRGNQPLPAATLDARLRLERVGGRWWRLRQPDGLRHTPTCEKCAGLRRTRTSTTLR